jgi:hypothetical protein
MKSNSLHLFLISSLFISSNVLADNFSAQPGSPTINWSPALRQYVNNIAGYRPETRALTDRLNKTIAYYKSVHILKTVTKSNYTVDCIPFAEQPALIDNPELAKTLLPDIITSTKQNLSVLKELGKNFDFNAATECPLGSVAIMRPSKAMLTSTMANQKVAPGKLSAKNTKGLRDYSWEQGYTPTDDTIYIHTDANQAYFKGPQLQHVNDFDFNDHSLDQFWFTNNPDDSQTF